MKLTRKPTSVAPTATRPKTPRRQALTAVLAFGLLTAGLASVASADVSYQAPHNTASNTVSASALTIPVPAVVADDVLLAQVGLTKDVSGAKICAPTGWTSVRRDHFENKYVQEIFVRVVADAAATSSATWDLKTSAGTCGTAGNGLTGKGATGAILRYTGVDTTTPIDAHLGASGGSSGPYRAPAVTTTVDGAQVVRFYTAEKKDVTWGPAATRVYNVQAENLSERTIAAFQTNQATAGSTGTFDATVNTSTEWVAATIALRPAPSEPAPTNTAPIYTAPSNQTACVDAEKAFLLGSFTDPDEGDAPWDVTVNWGDNSANDEFTVATAGDLGTRSHTYETASPSYIVTVTVDDGTEDDDGTFTVNVGACEPPEPGSWKHAPALANSVLRPGQCDTVWADNKPKNNGHGKIISYIAQEFEEWHGVDPDDENYEALVQQALVDGFGTRAAWESAMTAYAQALCGNKTAAPPYPPSSS